MLGDDRKNGEKIIIEHENLILCEGRDEYLFLIYYLNSKERSEEDKRFASCVQVESFGGNTELPLSLRVLQKIEGYSKIKRILIVRDAETNAKTAISQIKSALSMAKLPVPSIAGDWVRTEGNPYVAFLLFPSLDSTPVNGTLEHLCMKLIKPEFCPETVFEKVDCFMDELKKQNIREYKRDFKSRIHSFFSVTDDFVGLKLGECANAGAFDWGSEELEGLNKCLIEGFNRD